MFKTGFAVELNEWINSLAPVAASKAAAELLDEKRRTVDSWRRFENPPVFGAALKIVRRSHGLVDFNGIYGPYARSLEAAHGQS
jgi:hypothetical protein